MAKRFTSFGIWTTTYEKLNMLVEKYADGRSRSRVVEMMVDDWEEKQIAKNKQQVTTVPFEPKQNVG